jgi:hypothetical protein
LRTVPVPQPGHGQVLIRHQSSTILRQRLSVPIYREHSVKGPEGYQNKSHGMNRPARSSPAAPALRRFKTATAWIVYHISGCGFVRRLPPGLS